jgi:addiction module HigA family antidote
MTKKLAQSQSKSGAKRLASVTPGELLLEEFMLPMGLTAYRLAKEINVPAQRIGEIVKGKRGITADTDLRLCRFFDLSDGYWLRAQVAHDIQVAQVEIAKTLKAIKPWSTRLAS